MRLTAAVCALGAILGLGCLQTSALAQDTLDNPVSSMQPFTLESGVQANLSDEFSVVFSRAVRISDAAWVRLYFGDVVLEPGSFIRVTSMLDASTADMYYEDLEQWSFSTAYFNGDTVLLELIAAPGTSRNSISVHQVEIEELPAGEDISRGGGGQCGICGSDDRVPSSEEWACRLLPAGCSATIYNENSCIVSAGHCIGGNMVIQFNVPNSNSNCSLNHPPASDQFPVTNEIFANGGVGNDWAVMTSGTNNLGQRPYDRYGVYRPISLEPISFTDDCEMTGYGVDNTCVRSQTQQFAFGGVQAVLSLYFTYNIDLRGGNSGSSLIRDDEIVGIATHCPCPNIATRIDHPAFVAARESLCQTPTNDDCSDAQQIGVGETPFNTVSALTDGPMESDCGVGQIYRDVWFKFIPDCVGTVTASACDANFDAAMAAYFVSCPSGENMALACDVSSCNGKPTITFDVQPGFQYRIRIGSLTADTGSGTLTITCDEITLDNDDCADAIAIGNGVTEYTTVGATTDGPLEPGCGLPNVNDMADDVWFSYTADCTGTVTVDSCDSDFNNTLAAYASCPSGPDSAIACDENSCGSSRAVMQFSAVEGETYLIRVGGKNGQEGTGTLDISCEPGGECSGDINDDQSVDVSDLLDLLAAWGACPDGCPEDLNGDLTVDVSDLLELLAAWGPCP